MNFELKGNYFNGEFVFPATEGLHAVEKYIVKQSPANLDETLWRCPIEYNVIDNVIESAVNGFKVWKKTAIEDRISYLKKYQEQVLGRKEEIAKAIALETGKPLWEALTESAAIISKVDVTINDSLPRVRDEHIENITPDANGHVFYRPIGPSLVIGPFNFPCHLANGQILSALIAGNSVIFKPSEKTCYSAQLLIECFHQAQFPKGVINLIQGDGEVASRLTKSRPLKGIFFTGSKEIGLKILENTYSDLSKLVCLELGGKNTSIIHKDANIDFALSELLKASFLTSGQRCTSTALVAIHNDIKDEFISRFHKLAKRIIIDHPIDHEKMPFMGPLIDESAVNTYLNFVGMAKREGIEEIMRGKSIERKYRGHYVTPSIHYTDHFNHKSIFLTNELFGPNCTFISYENIEEAINIANSTEYGLASAIYTADKSLYNKCVEEIETGLLNYNRSTVGASSQLPFGGVKNSGNYRPAAVSTIDACVYPMSSLEVTTMGEVDLDNIPGLS
ncbi:MAG: aldehyde dehydrogenase family protein [Halobacteriovoraceae bacterium]|nr:aldehyde dehydrogenase family protein [Halobacteriovoraceae bacterium]